MLNLLQRQFLKVSEFMVQTCSVQEKTTVFYKYILYLLQFTDHNIEIKFIIVINLNTNYIVHENSLNKAGFVDFIRKEKSLISK